MIPRLLALAVAAVMVSACVADSVRPLPEPSSLPPTTASTVPPDLAQVGLPAVPGRTTTTVALGPGRATLTGFVIGPDGAVPGATVRIERFVGDARAHIDVATDAEGRYTVPELLGGRVRVRAWKPAPDNLALTAPELFFLEDDKKKELDLAVSRQQGMSVSFAIGPDPPVLDQRANLVVQVVNREVSVDGIVRSEGIAGIQVELFGSGDWRLVDQNVQLTDGGGRATWTVVCQRAGKQPLSVVVADAETFALDLPACAVPPPEPEPEPGGEADGANGEGDEDGDGADDSE